MDLTPSPFFVFLLALLALGNHIVAYVARLNTPRFIAIPRAVGASVVMCLYAYLSFHPEMSHDARSLIVRWALIILFAPEGYPVTYLLARRRVKHGNRDN